MNEAISNSYFDGHIENFKEIFCHQKWNNNAKKEREKDENNDKSYENIIYHCGGKGHLGRTCLTSKHPIKQREKHRNTPCMYKNDDFDFGHMNVTHFDIFVY